MKCYLKYNFQYLIIAIFWTGLALYHLINTDKMVFVIGGLIASVLSIGWSIYNYCDVFVRLKRRV